MNEHLPGQHVAVNRGLYTHHAIFMGWRDGRAWVAELAKPRDGGIVRLIPWDMFAQGVPVHLVEHSNGLPLGEVVANVWRAWPWHRYDLLHWNCETFATWCATHQARSLQVERASAVAASIAALLIVSALAA